ncbi:MAG: hypothetical protein LBJ11_08645 [Oscillospiraceae bacterium]|jgi:hypothetical protein|nr:hypothetical protein [Oscillospiraceae bacterium]
MRKYKRWIAALLAALTLIGMAVISSGAAVAPGVDEVTWAVDDHPTIILHGLGQSNVFLYDEQGNKVQDENGNYIQGWPPKIDANAILKKVAFPLVISTLFQHDLGLTKALRSAVNDAFTYFKMDETGMPIQNMQVERVQTIKDGEPTSFGEMTGDLQWAQDFAYGSMPVQALADAIGEDKLYYFAYDSFGNNRAITDELYQLIQKILVKHHTDKVNLIPISLGGTIMNSLVDYYPSVKEQLHNVVYVIAAVDGSKIVGDIFNRRLSTDNENLYRDMLPKLVDGYLGYLLNIVIRLLPKQMVKSLLDTVVDGLVGDVIVRSTTMWSLCPSDDYETARALWLQGDELADIRRQTDRYYQAQVNAHENILDMQRKGVNVYAIAEYNKPLLSIVGSYTKYNADGIIHLDSTSLGAHSGYIDTPLPADYQPETGTKRLSPDGIIDASTGILPNHTFYFKNQAHEGTSKDDLIIRLIARLVSSKNPETVTSMPEWPQFNIGRETRWLRNDALRMAGEADRSKLSAADAAELDAAVQEVLDMLQTTIAKEGAKEAAEKRLSDIMTKIGAFAPPEDKTTDVILEKITHFLSDAFYYGYGPRGFSDPIWKICK